MAKLAIWSSGALIGCIFGVTGCGAQDDASSATQGAEGVGTMNAELSSVPTGVACVQFVLSGATTATKSLPATAGTTPVKLNLGPLPAGSTTITAKAFNSSCSAITSSSVPSWVSTSTQTVVTPGQTTEIGITLRANLSVSAKVDFLANAVSVSAGDANTFAILSDGTVRAWGFGAHGELGDGTTNNRSTPVAVTGLTGVTSVGAGSYHACALTNSGQIRCWGFNGYGQLGNGTMNDSPSPVNVSSSLTFRGLIVGQGYSCGAIATGLYCWGDNGYGQFCNGTTTSSSSPVATGYLLPDFFVAGATAYTTFVYSGNSSSACGLNTGGQLGNGSSATSVPSWTTTGFTAAGTRFITAAASGTSFACAVEASAGNVYCSGNNSLGQLGNGTTTSSNVPVQVSGLSDVTAVSAGAFHACALKSDGSAWCWGNNPYGQLGDGTGTTRLTPTLVSGLSSGVTSIATGSGHTCATKTDGTVWCWGNNGAAQIGDGTQVHRGVPTKVLL